MKEKEIKKIIISRTDKIGDLVLSIPSFFMAKKMFPKAKLIILVRKYNYEIVKNLPYVDKVLKIDDYKEKELVEEIKNMGVDIFVALYNDKLVMKLAKASEAKIKIAPLSKIKSFFIYNYGVLQKRSKSIKNEAEYNLELIEKIDPLRYQVEKELETKLFYEDKHRLEALNFLKKENIYGKILVINPFMGGSAKNITDVQYIELIVGVLGEIEDLDVILTCHVSEKDRGVEIMEKVGDKRLHLYANKGDLLNLAAIIDKSTVYFGGSTGPTHIAGALGKRIVALYPNKKTQSPTRWGVFGNENTMYIVPDRGKVKEDYSHKFFDSYNNNTKQDVIKAIKRSLEDE